MQPGETIYMNGDIELNAGRRTAEVVVVNICDRPIQIGSHFHFFEVNKLLKFDRKMAYGMRLDIPSGTAVRFEPGEKKKVRLVELGGKCRVFGLNGLTNGSVRPSAEKKSLEEARLKGFMEDDI